MKEMIYKDMSTPEILDEGHYKQYHYAIVSLGSHPCAYVELPENHQFYEKFYDDIPIECHGGLTYSSITFQGRTWSTEEILSEVKQVIDQLCEMDLGGDGNE